MATHSSKKHKLLGAPAPLDTGAPVFARLPTDEHWLENVKLVKAHRDGEIPWKTIVFFALAPPVAVRGSEGATGYDRHMGVTEWSDKQDKTLKCTRRRLYSHYCSHQRRFRAF